MNKIKLVLASFLALGCLFTPAVVLADATPGQWAQCGANQTWNSSGQCVPTTDVNTGVSDKIKLVIDILSWIVGVISVIMIIIGGFRYVISAGEEKHVTGAKNTIMYAIIGLIIVALAQIIVNFVLNRFVNS